MEYKLQGGRAMSLVDGYHCLTVIVLLQMLPDRLFKKGGIDLF